ncbi:uncharacterized protein LOC112555891 [Pomacea canaliculata]|uniref:uncharacterized protein LOC112555891 n=1 Tax=Pomacea canaliculata TaxID=400727 RepID=UPI000D734E78|nr:uncharacterized protein LOC112555891 [Pomacea canaliculata]
MEMFPRVWFLVILCGLSRADAGCEEEQDALIKCIEGYDVSEALSTEEIDKMCSDTRYLLDCVRVARGSCPNMALLGDEEFAAAVDNMGLVYNTYCAATTTTEAPFLNDQQKICSDPWEAITDCNQLMAGVPPGDLKVMCSQKGNEYLQCLDNIVASCDQLHKLPFDLQSAVNTTRELLARECPGRQKVDACEEKSVEAEYACAGHLTDSTSDDIYCVGLSLYVDCLKHHLSTCPNSRMLQSGLLQFDIHC